jgi:hypothetical protein
VHDAIVAAMDDLPGNCCVTISEPRNKDGWIIEITGPTRLDWRQMFSAVEEQDEKAEVIADAVRRLISQATGTEDIGDGRSPRNLE